MINIEAKNSEKQITEHQAPVKYSSVIPARAGARIYKLVKMSTPVPILINKNEKNNCR